MFCVRGKSGPKPLYSNVRTELKTETHSAKCTLLKALFHLVFVSIFLKMQPAKTFGIILLVLCNKAVRLTVYNHVSRNNIFGTVNRVKKIIPRFSRLIFMYYKKIVDSRTFYIYLFYL